MHDKELKTVNFQYQARYHQIGEFTQQTTDLWLVCHGYGQLANYFINHFRVLEAPNRVIVAPEGLNRFYLQGFQGRVGATWMTKEDRLTDIHNYVAYLDAVFAAVTQGKDLSTIKVHLVGFSQGAATVSRWIVDSSFEFNRLILWAGIFPPDLNIPKGKRRLQDHEVLFVYGDEDPFLKKDDRVQEQRSIARVLGVEPRIIKFHGEHVIDRETLLSVAQ